MEENSIGVVYDAMSYTMPPIPKMTNATDACTYKEGTNVRSYAISCFTTPKFDGATFFYGGYNGTETTAEFTASKIDAICPGWTGTPGTYDKLTEAHANATAGDPTGLNAMKAL